MANTMIVLRLEAIGDNWRAYAKALRAGKVSHPAWRDQLGAIRYGQKRHGPWVARITGNGREFLHGPRDYSAADKIGERGVFDYYYLTDGLYEVNEPTGLGQARRYFVQVERERLVKLGARRGPLECQNEHWD